MENIVNKFVKKMEKVASKPLEDEQKVIKELKKSLQQENKYLQTIVQKYKGFTHLTQDIEDLKQKINENKNIIDNL